MSDLRYPIGRFDRDQTVTPKKRLEWIDVLERTPADMRAAVAGLNDTQLDTPYRPEGWTVRQVVHHVPDSHLNSYIRFRWALTEDEPVIKPYDEKAWAQLPDAASAPIDLSLNLLDAVHRRLVYFLRKLTDADFNRSFRHPEIGILRLDTVLGLYAWHGRHHVAHITSLREREGW